MLAQVSTLFTASVAVTTNGTTYSETYSRRQGLAFGHEVTAASDFCSCLGVERVPNKVDDNTKLASEAGIKIASNTDALSIRELKFINVA